MTKPKTRTCLNCKEKFVQKRNGQSVCSNICAFEYVKKQKKKKAKSFQRNKRKTHSHLYIKENKNDLQKSVNEIVRLIDKDCRCIDCERTQPKPCWDAGHRTSRGANPTLRYHLDNIFKQDRYCNSISEGNKEAYNNGVIDMYGQEYYDYINTLHLEYPALNLHHSEIPEALKEARKIARELKKLDLTYTPKQRIKLRKKYNKRLGIYK
jgi:hypothetical protein